MAGSQLPDATVIAAMRRRYDSGERPETGAAANMAPSLIASAHPVVEAASRAMSGNASPSPLVGTSPSMVRLRHEIGRMATTSFTVLVKGESGSGKELVARAIHEQSPRSKGPFVAVNCAALVESLLEAELFGIEDRTATGVRGRPGKFELADGGTLLLDEVADLSLPAQAKLLRVIQEMAVERVGGHVTRNLDTRLVVATNQCLSDLVGAERFREDLYYRLSGLEICGKNHNLIADPGITCFNGAPRSARWPS